MPRCTERASMTAPGELNSLDQKEVMMMPTRTYSEVAASRNTTSFKQAIREMKRRRMKSQYGPKKESPGRQRNREDVYSEVPASALAEMYELNAVARQPGKQGMSKAEMQSTWARCRSSWFAMGDPPRNLFGCSAGSEEAFSRRNVCITPATNQRPEEVFGQCGIWVENLKGMKGRWDKTIGQDNFSIALLEGGWELYVVCDGHGDQGHWPAMRAVQMLTHFMLQESCAMMIRQGRIDAALLWAFQQVEQDLELTSRQTNSCNLIVCGCTCVCMLRHPSKKSLWVGHVGDSRAVLMAEGQGVVAETADHKPSVPSERKRLEECGCEVRKQEYEDGWSEERVFVKGKRFPGILMTRSLGDTAVKKKGLIATPEVVEWQLDGHEGAVVLLASDGIWEFIESKEAAEVVLKSRETGESLQKIAEKLVTFAQDLWESKEPDYCDDCTAILVDLNGPGLQPVRRTGGSKSETCCASCCLGRSPV